MIPGRGLRPHHLLSSTSRVSFPPRGHAARKFSSVPRSASLATLPHTSSSFCSARWRVTANAQSTAPHILSASSVRYGSWYAPWSWGRSNTPPDALQASELSSEPAAGHAEPTTLAPDPEPAAASTPELPPGGIDQPAVVGDVNTNWDELRAQLQTTLPKSSLAEESSEMISYWGQLKELGLDYGWGPTASVESLIELCYLHTGFGWAGSIVLTSVIIRCGLFYFQMRASDAGAKIAAMRPALQPIMDEMEAAKRRGDEEAAAAAKQKQGIIMREAGGIDSVLSGLYMPVLQGVIGYGAYRCLRGMNGLPVPGMNEDGWLWFTNLTVPDPYYVLPIMTGGIMYTVLKLGGESGMNTEMQMTSLQKRVMVVMPFLLSVITSIQPAGTQLYFVCTAILGGVTSQLLRRPTVRRVLGLRLLPTKQSNAFYDRVIKGEISLKEARSKNARLHYMAPNGPRSPKTPMSSKKFSSASASAVTLVETISIKPGTELPAHLRKPAPPKAPQEYVDRDHDYDANFRQLSFSEKIDWIKRNFRPRYLYNRFRNLFNFDKRDWQVKERDQKKLKKKEEEQEYKEQREKRLQGR